jgi:hypothetical protein
LPVKSADGPDYLQLLVLFGIATVLSTRTYLALTGYPRIGTGTLHIAHVLWGGLLMLGGLTSALLFVGTAARVFAALLGGVGLGLFVDEVGKFVTSRNDYFFRPAAGIIYLLFAGLLVLTVQVRRRPPVDAGSRLTNAAQIAATGLVGGLTARQRETATRLLDGRDDEATRAVRRLLDAAPTRQSRWPVRRVARHAVAVGGWLADRRWFMPALVGLFVVSRVVVALVFVVQALVLTAGHRHAPGAETGAIVASAVTRGLSATLAVVGLLQWRGNRHAAYRWFKAAVLVGLLVTQVFNFTDSQFRAVWELPFDLLVLAAVSYRLSPADRAGNGPSASLPESPSNSRREVGDVGPLIAGTAAPALRAHHRPSTTAAAGSASAPGPPGEPATGACPAGGPRTARP